MKIKTTTQFESEEYKDSPLIIETEAEVDMQQFIKSASIKTIQHYLDDLIFTHLHKVKDYWEVQKDLDSGKLVRRSEN